MIYTTLNKILSHLGKTQPDDDPLPLVTLLDSNGLDDTIRCLRAHPDVAVEFTRWCADRAAYWATIANRGTRSAARATWFAGMATWAADRAAASYDRAPEAAWDAAYAAAGAADRAAGITAAEVERQAQADKLRELLS